MSNTILAHLLRIGLILLVTALPVATYQQLNNAQPSNWDSSNIVFTTIAHKLRKLNLLTEATYQEVMRLIKGDGILSRSALVHRLEQDALKRLLGSNINGAVNIAVAEFTDEMRSQLLKLLQQLKESGVLSDRVYTQLQADITAGRIKLDVALFQQAATYMETYEELQPTRVEPFLKSLRKVGVLSENSYTQLLQDLNAGSINDSCEFLNYFDRSVLLRVQNYSLDPYDYFPKIHQIIAQMLTKTGVANITFDDFALKTNVDIENSDDNAVVSVRVNGKQYQQSSYYSTPQSRNDFLGRIDSDQFIHLFNKILRDQGSPYQLYTVTAFSYELGVPAVDYSRFGVLALTPQQAKVYFKQDNLSAPTFTSDRLNEILTLFEQIGLFNHLTQEQIAVGKQLINQTYITHPYQLLEAFDNLVVTFDWESGNIDNPYQALTNQFAAASRGAFAPTDVSNDFDWEKQVAGQSFILNGTRYSTKLKFNDDWLDPEFFTFITGVIQKTVTQGRFYPLYNEYEISGYIFLTDQQRRVLQSEKLIVLEPST